MSASIVLFDPRRDYYEDLTALLHAAYADLAAMGFNYVDGHLDRANDERMLGVVSYYDCASFRHGEPEWYQRPEPSIFAPFAVDVALRGTGLGPALLRMVEERARSDGKAETNVLSRSRI